MKVSKLIHDLHEKVENLEKENVELKSNMELGVDWEYDNDGNHVAYSKDDLNRQITELKKENKRLYQACHLNEVIKLRKENVRLVAQLENDEHNAQTNKVR